MSLSTHYLSGKRAISKQKLAFTQRLRQNFFLKCLSLVTAVLLYFYVQQERNPMVPRQFLVPITIEGQPPEVSLEYDQQPMKVTVTGPQPVVEALKDSDIRIVADLHAAPGDKIETERVRLHYDVKLSHEMQMLLSYDPWPLPKLEVQVSPQQTREVTIEAHFPQEARAGYHYGSPSIEPERVHFTGRIDRVRRVTHVVADAISLETGGGIDNSFPLSARDSNNNPVEGLIFDVQKAHVKVPIIPDPYSRILSISPIFNDQPPPGYRIVRVVVEPNQVRAMGRPEVVDTLSTLSTEEISIHDMMGNQVLTVPIVTPKGVTVRDASGNLITKVTVRINVQKQDTSVPPNSGQPVFTQP